MTAQTPNDLERMLVGIILRHPAKFRAVGGMLADVRLADPFAATVWESCRRVAAEGHQPGIHEVTLDLHNRRPVGLPEAWWADLAGWASVQFETDTDWLVPKIAENAHFLALSEWSARIAGAHTLSEREAVKGKPPVRPKCLGEGDTWKDAVRRWLKTFEDMASGRAEKPPQHGIWFADDAQGGCWPGELEVVAADTGGGKTIFMLQVMRNLAASVPVLYASYEMPTDGVITRLFSQFTGFGPRSLRTPTEHKGIIQKVALKMGDVARLNVHVLNCPSMDEIRAKQDETGARVILFDYIQRAAALGAKNREEAVASVSRELKDIALRTGTTIIAGSQLNDDGRLRDSRAVGMDADLVIFLDERSARIGKARYGERNVEYPIRMNFEHQTIESLQSNGKTTESDQPTKSK